MSAIHPHFLVLGIGGMLPRKNWLERLLDGRKVVPLDNRQGSADLVWSKEYCLQRHCYSHGMLSLPDCTEVCIVSTIDCCLPIFVEVSYSDRLQIARDKVRRRPK
jgi:hypothetical protein